MGMKLFREEGKILEGESFMRMMHDGSFEQGRCFCSSWWIVGVKRTATRLR